MNRRYFLIFFSTLLGIGQGNGQYKTMYSGTSSFELGSALVLSHYVLYGYSHYSSNTVGNIFRINSNETGFKDLFDFNGLNGANPTGLLTPSVTGDTLFGTTALGDSSYNPSLHMYGYGCIFSIKTDGTGYRKIFDFGDTNGLAPNGSLKLIGAKLYGMTNSGGAHSLGCVFSICTNGTGTKTSMILME